MFLDPVPLFDATFTVRDPYTATLGIPISAKDRPWAEGTGGFYLSAGGDDSDIYLVTARHVVLPLDKGDNKEYECKDDSQAREDVVVLGTSCFNEKLAATDAEIDNQEFVISVAKERIELVGGKDDSASVSEHRDAGHDLRNAQRGLEGLKTFRDDIATHWEAKENRVFGELVWASPIVLSTDPGQYTLDLAVIKINAGILDANNYRGNSINIGNNYMHHKFMKRAYLHPTGSTSFKLSADRCVALQDQVPECALFKPPVPNANDESCFAVFKNGAKTGVTIGKANNVSSYTRNYFAGQYQESREWPVIPIDEKKWGAPYQAFSAKGDSGSCVANISGRFGGILTGGSGDTDSCDVSYVTPISFIMKVFHDTKRFKHAHLNPAPA